MKLFGRKCGFIQLAGALTAPMLIAIIAIFAVFWGSSLLFLFTNKWILYLILLVVVLRFFRR